MSIKSIWRWFVGDDEPLGPESERGLFNHFNSPESLPWPPINKSLKPLTDKPKPRQFKVEELSSSAAYYEEEQRRFFAEERRKHIEWLNQLFPKSGVTFVDPDTKRGSAHGKFRISTATGKAALVDGEYKPTFRETEPRELKPTVGYYNSPPPRDYPNAPTIPVPYAVRPIAVTEALKIGDTHPDVYEYIVHLESHFARTHHHG